MKRSDAVQIMQDILDIIIEHDLTEINPDWLLYEIEGKIGMLPPKRSVVYKPLPSKTATADSYTWEPEDE